MKTARISRWEIDAHILAEQLARARDRSESAEWVLADPEDGLPGLVLRETTLRSLSSGVKERACSQKM